MSFTVAVWFWLSFTNRPPYPMYLSVEVARDGDNITCQSDTIDIPHVDCNKSYLTVAMPSNDGQRVPSDRFSLRCVNGQPAAHIEVLCK